MIEKLKKLKERYIELTALVSDPDVISNQREWSKLAKELAGLEEIVQKYDEYIKVENDINDAKEMIKTETDKDMQEMLNEEIYGGKEKLEKIVEDLKVLLLPKDENDEKNVIMEIRAGAGGEEAGLFASELKRMYSLYCEKQGFTMAVISENISEGGGLREGDYSITGKGAFAKLKFESGVHRVQRVPDTESSGRIHTSTATVAVLPEAPEVDIEIDDKDLEIDTYRSSGAGGQHVNKTESAIRITHKPTGIVVACQDERSQIKNRERAMGYLKSKLYDYYQSQADKEYGDERRSQIGSGDRSEKTRTYNFPQNRVTDHRINYTMYNLEGFMNGDIGDIIERLRIADQQAKLLANAENVGK